MRLYHCLQEVQDVSDEQIQEFIQANEALANVPPSDEMKDFQKIYEENGGGVLGFTLGVANNMSVIPQLFVSSVSAMLNPTSLAAGAATGAAGAAVGSVASDNRYRFWCNRWFYGRCRWCT